MAEYKPEIALNLKARYISKDKFSNHTFGLDKNIYDSLKYALTKNKNENYKTPLSSYEYSGKTYYNLKVKEKNISHKVEKNKGKSMNIEVLFFNYDYLGKQGVRVVVQDYKVVEDQMPKFECVSLDDIMK